jgi:hypothetical protein
MCMRMRTCVCACTCVCVCVCVCVCLCLSLSVLLIDATLACGLARAAEAGWLVHIVNDHLIVRPHAALPGPAPPVPDAFSVRAYGAIT